MMMETLESRMHFSSVVITTGGIYTGTWDSNDPNIPAVTIKTSQPVTIQNSTITGKSNLIKCNTTASLTLSNVQGYSINPNVLGRAVGRFLDADSGITNIDIQNCYMEGTGGILLDGQNISGGTIKVLDNEAKNIDGRHSNGNGGWITTNNDSDYEIVQFVQVAQIPTVGSCEIARNKVTNIKGQSRVEDNINIYKSSGTASNRIRIHDNLVNGAYKANPTVADSNGFAGGGIIVDYKSNYVDIYNNTVLNTTNYSVAISSGHDNRLILNRVVNDEILPDSVNSSIYIWDSYHLGGFTNNEGRGNMVKVANNQPWWHPDASVWYENVQVPRTPGDADGNGVIDADDYFAIDVGYARKSTGWINGDFNVNGVIEGDDYFIIDMSYSNTPFVGQLTVADSITAWELLNG